jgi:hypothetical protein
MNFDLMSSVCASPNMRNKAMKMRTATHMHLLHRQAIFFFLYLLVLIDRICVETKLCQMSFPGLHMCHVFLYLRVLAYLCLSTILIFCLSWLFSLCPLACLPLFRLSTSQFTCFHQTPSFSFFYFTKRRSGKKGTPILMLVQITN